ncbi:hypothetical protein GCM10011346_50590 [Oceanobacillus neutriphilus]|uniref:Uncharacterized protein n=1 Tax=Oceanobacillus neutriphilus TaxID=531815 RepID=A0ABQ2P2Z9_9BACI|nr:hypothetical protein GCM10011346_50590 [Oceanobacillus neutriphilus]
MNQKKAIKIGIKIAKKIIRTFIDLLPPFFVSVISKSISDYRFGKQMDNNLSYIQNQRIE